MFDRLAELARRRGLEIAVAVALGTALVAVADALTGAAMSVAAEHVGRSPFDETPAGQFPIDPGSAPAFFNFEIGSTVVFYGGVVSASAALGLVAFVALIVVRRRDRELGACPFCASRIPYESTHCAYCGSAVAPGEP
jgi:hypothetical protein